LPPSQGCLPVNITETPESIILNSRINSGLWPFNSKTQIPHAGVWTFDYVHKIKPQADAVAMDEDEFMRFIGVRFDAIDAVNAICPSDGDHIAIAPSAFHHGLHEDDGIAHPQPQPLPHSPSPSDWERVPPLSAPELQNELHERAGDLCTAQWLTLRQSMMLVKRIGNIYLQIDIIVSLWPRIIDWHGFDQVKSKIPFQNSSLRTTNSKAENLFSFLTIDAAPGDASY
jgi:hypothetical protein